MAVGSLLGSEGSDSTQDPAVQPIRILAIAGTGQNGATLVSRLLGELPAFAAIGEIGRLWDKGLIEGVECSCGAPFLRCPFWTEVGRETFGGWSEVDAQAALKLRHSLMLKESRLQHPFALPFILAPGLWPSYAQHLADYQELMSKLYRGIRQVVGDRVIVDAMKIPAHVFMLSGLIPNFDVRFVHLVRDSRGVAHSNDKVVLRQGSLPDQPYRGRRGAATSAMKWTWFNLSSEALSAVRRVPMIRVRYEEFVRRPAVELRRIAEHMDVHLSDADLAFMDGKQADLSSGHLVAGNRMRHDSGPITIAEDDGWRRDLSKRSRRVVTGMTWPLLRHCGHLPAHNSLEDRPPSHEPASSRGSGPYDGRDCRDSPALSRPRVRDDRFTTTAAMR